MDEATKEKFKEQFGPDVIFDLDEDSQKTHEAAKRLMPFVLDMMKPCKHELVGHVFPIDPRLEHFMCRCGKEQFIQCTKACADEILADKDTRNVSHKVKNHVLIELFGIEVRIKG